MQNMDTLASIFAYLSRLVLIHAFSYVITSDCVHLKDFVTILQRETTFADSIEQVASLVYETIQKRGYS